MHRAESRLYLLPTISNAQQQHSAKLAGILDEVIAAAAVGSQVCIMTSFNSESSLGLDLQVFENGASFVVVSFDAAAAEQEGDVAGYMGELARLNSVPGSWQLCKSTLNWGQLQVPGPCIGPASSGHKSSGVQLCCCCCSAAQACTAIAGGMKHPLYMLSVLSAVRD